MINWRTEYMRQGQHLTEAVEQIEQRIYISIKQRQAGIDYEAARKLWAEAFDFLTDLRCDTI